MKRKVLSEALKYLELEEMEELTVIFNKLDKDHDGYITKKEMVKGLVDYGYQVRDRDKRTSNLK